MEQGLGLIVLVAVGALCVVSLSAVLGVLFPRPLERTRQAAEEGPGRAFLIGLVNLLFLSAAGIGLGILKGRTGIPGLEIVILLIVAILAIGLTFGIAGMSQLIGVRMQPDRGSLYRNSFGTTTLVLACLTPYVGWYGLLPFLAISGLGAFVLAVFGGRGKQGLEVAAES